MLVGGADGCSSDPNVEGAKLNLRNQEYAEALRNVDTALETNPDNVEALTLKAEILARQMDQAPVAERAALVPDMIQSISRAMTLAPEDADVEQMRQFVWATVMTRGNQSLQNEATAASDAVPFFTGANEIAPDSSGGHFSLGLAYLLDAQNAEAASAFERAIEIDDMYTNAYIYLSKAYLEMDRGADAVDILATARGLIPETDESRERLEQEYLNTLATSGQTERAVAEFEQQIDRNGNDPLIRYNYGTLLLGVERFEDAIEQFQVASDLEPDNEDAFYNLGVALLRYADQIGEAAGELTLDQQEQYDAMIADRNEQIEMAIEALTTARDLAPEAKKPAVCNSLMTVYSSLGRADEAEEAAECAGISMN